VRRSPVVAHDSPSVTAQLVHTIVSSGHAKLGEKRYRHNGRDGSTEFTLIVTRLE
jgi:hypothetical protein